MGADPHVLTALGYVLIPIWMEVIRQRMRWKPAPWQLGLYWGFALFVLSCALDHAFGGFAWLEALTVWAYIGYALWATVYRIGGVPSPPEYEEALFRRVRYSTGLGRAIWMSDGSLRMDNASRRNVGLPELEDESKWMSAVVPYDAWAALVLDDMELLKAQRDVAPALADGGSNNQFIRYKNGRVVQGFGTARANGYTWAGFNKDSTELYYRLRAEVEQDASKIAVAAEKRREAEVARLQGLLRKESANFIASKLREGISE